MLTKIEKQCIKIMTLFLYQNFTLEGKMKELLLFLQKIPSEWLQDGARFYFFLALVLSVFGWLDYWRKKVVFSRER
ncbi:hypothetical protein A2477_03205 [Candidatus Falkowbacteria bacterium RIFOXYC2_FULL_47_12]|uniref:Uncharacterized protein n=2 Tax=Candidatus Falkowiibacteriota TaxID=1752728 RepID=A0A1F5TQV2_9BACT|nr:MAG: hypothetical protein A2242_01900 [Candidatus Falkowbacteria bacterium RIFOXYA2_FULL_47_9]OGF41336.1 MAG: hypothetical protein A2477_03205 [Candidatus Falkowbacteria bacterium RIFOXYC2_FULL_47_12]